MKRNLFVILILFFTVVAAKADFAGKELILR
jgi:hypothetical protein